MVAVSVKQRAVVKIGVSKQCSLHYEISCGVFITNIYYLHLRCTHLSIKILHKIYMLSTTLSLSKILLPVVNFSFRETGTHIHVAAMVIVSM